MASCLISRTHQVLSEKKGYSKRKEFASTGSKFFLFRVDPVVDLYQKEGKATLIDLSPKKVIN